ncbi:Uncharacterised protein [Mycobacteroides abscessus subsp. abscessus]|nr:Uncharacterised protein [Mycobacteroides abscessus subsp. abscessus]
MNFLGEVEGGYQTTRHQYMVSHCKEAAGLLKAENFGAFDFLICPEGTHDAHDFINGTSSFLGNQKLCIWLNRIKRSKAQLVFVH